MHIKIYSAIYIYICVCVNYPNINPVPITHKAKTYPSNKHTPQCFVTELPVRSGLILTDYNESKRTRSCAQCARFQQNSV